MNGQLIPLSGGDPIPLLKDHVIVGRRPTCDVCLDQANVSGKHCELLFENGGWSVRDLRSANGVKVNGTKVERRRLMSGDEICIARQHTFRIEYNDEAAIRTFRADPEDEEDQIFKRSLLERAGLKRSEEFDDPNPPPRPGDRETDPKSRPKRHP